MGLWLTEDGGHLDDEAGAPLADEAPLPAFPATVLGILVELLINGTWTDITAYVQQRADITIIQGRPNEAAKAQPASMQLTLNNRGGDFSPKNASGQYFPYIGRNTQVRVSVAAQSGNATAYSGYRFWGEVSQWPPQWDKTGADVWVPVTAGGILRRYLQGGLIGSPLRRFYLLKNPSTDATAPVALWTCEDQSGASQFTSALVAGSAMTFTGSPTLATDSSFAGTSPLPQLNSSVWTGSTGSYSTSGPVTFSTPGTYSWLCPGGVTSLTSAECWGGGGGGHNGYQNNFQQNFGGGGGEYAKETSVAVTPGNTYTVTVGAGGQGGYLAAHPPASIPGAAGATSSFPGDSVTVTAHGGGGGFGGSGGTGGTGSGNTTHFSGGAGGHAAGSAGNYGGGGGGGSGGSAAGGNAGSNATGNTGAAGGAAVTGGGKGGAGGNGGGGVDKPGLLGAVPGGGGGSGGENVNNSAAHSGGAGGSGQVKLSFTSSTTPNNVVVRFLLSVPAAGTVNAATIVRAVVSSGTLSKIECYYGTGGKLGFRGFNTVPAVVFDSGLLAFATDGQPMMVSMELAKSGTAIAWKMVSINIASGLLFTTSGTLAASTVGAVSSVVVNPGANITNTAIGFIVLQYALESLAPAVLAAIRGFAGESVAARLTRLAGETGIAFSLTGNGKSIDTPAMGAQQNVKLIDALQACEDADQGLLHETRDAFGLGYRTRTSLQNQGAAAVLDYSAAVLSDVPVPQYDDSLTRNDVTVTRVNGGAVNAQLATGALSVQAPPNGVGDYSFSLTASLSADTQLASLAAWLLATGTVDEYRFPSVPLDMMRTAVQSLFSAIPSLAIGDYFQITNPPSWVPSSPVKQLLFGYAESLNAFKWQFTLNGVPESPYETALNPNILVSSSGTGWSGFNGSFAVTSSPPAGAPWPFAGVYVNNGVTAGAMEETGGSFAISPAVTYQVSCRLYSTSGSVRIGFDNQDGAHGFLSTSAVNRAVTPNTWTYLISGALTPDPAAVFAYPRVGTQTNDGSTVWAQQVVMQPIANFW